MLPEPPKKSLTWVDLCFTGLLLAVGIAMIALTAWFIFVAFTG